MLMPFHAAVMLFQCMFVRKETGVSFPWPVVMTIGMMALIVMHPAWCRSRPMLPVVMTMTVGMSVMCGYCTFIAMIITGRGSPWKYETDGGNRSE